MNTWGYVAEENQENFGVFSKMPRQGELMDKAEDVADQVQHAWHSYHCVFTLPFKRKTTGLRYKPICLKRQI